MQTQEEQFIKVTGVVHDPFEDINKNLKTNLFSSLEISDTISVEDSENQAFSEKIIQHSARNYRSAPNSSFRT